VISENEPPDNLLWHYTGFDGLKGIVLGRRIWASGCRYLNDAGEFQHYFDLVGKCLDAEGPPFPHPRCPTTKWIFDNILYWMKNISPMYVSSFSRKGDDLSQWRGYSSAPGLSFALGFERTLLRKCVEAQQFKLTEIEYKVDKQTDTLRSLVKDRYAYIRSMPEFSDGEIWPATGETRIAQEVCKRIYNRISEDAVFNKSPAFKDEAEERVWHNGHGLAAEYRAGRSLIVPYVEWGIPATGEPDCPLKYVYVGPGPHKKQVLEMVSQMCHPNVWVMSSKLPYRNW
jgi:hypothetical protein